jgi:hypothetical protein
MCMCMCMACKASAAAISSEQWQQLGGEQQGGDVAATVAAAVIKAQQLSLQRKFFAQGMASHQQGSAEGAGSSCQALANGLAQLLLLLRCGMDAGTVAGLVQSSGFILGARAHGACATAGA